MIYTAAIRMLGKTDYLEIGNCYESGFTSWIKRASEHSKRLGGIKCFVDFIQRPHTFEVQEDGRSHLLTPTNGSIITDDNPVIIDPALNAQYEGS